MSIAPVVKRKEVESTSISTNKKPKVGDTETILQFLFREHAPKFNDYNIDLKSKYCATLSIKPDSEIGGLKQMQLKFAKLGLKTHNVQDQLEVDCQEFENTKIGENFVRELEDWAKQQAGDVSEAVSRIKTAFYLNHCVLSLSNLHLSSLPSCISQLKKLRILDLENNNLQSIPSEIFNHPQLVRLNLAGNQLEALPGRNNRRSELKWLNLKGNNFQTLPLEITTLYELIELDMEGNQLTGLPYEMGRCRKLEFLNLKSNRFSTFPTITLAFPELRRLNLAGNQLTTLPNILNGWRKLQILNLANNQMGDLPAGIRELLPSLQELNIGEEQFETLPLWMKDFFDYRWHFKVHPEPVKKIK